MNFPLPDREAIYPYVWTYPANGWVMYGALYATNNPDELPSLDEDLNIPEPVRNVMAVSNSTHPYPYPMEAPILPRLFIPESSPVSIAVGMEKNQATTGKTGS